MCTIFTGRCGKKTGCKGKTIEMKVCFQYKSTTKYAVYDNSGFSGVSREKQVIAYYLQITQKVKSSYCKLLNPVFFPKLRLSLMNERRTINKTRTSKVGAISKAQKAQNIFLEKNLKFSKNFFFRKMSHSVEKCKKGTLFGL